MNTFAVFCATFSARTSPVANSRTMRIFCAGSSKVSATSTPGDTCNLPLANETRFFPWAGTFGLLQAQSALFIGGESVKINAQRLPAIIHGGEGHLRLTGF